MPLIRVITEKQSSLQRDNDAQPAPHQPSMLLIGCVDARKDPINDLGIPKGSALILRNVAALVHPAHEKRLTESAALEFAVCTKKVKHIAVMGHTDCGGIHAAVTGGATGCVKDYLAPINSMRDAVVGCVAGEQGQRTALEQEAVRYSVRNLRSYHYIRDAEAAGELTLHGWVLDIASGMISRWIESDNHFVPMGDYALKL